MNPLLDTLLVALIVLGAAFFLYRTWFGKKPGKAAGCGTCGSESNASKRTLAPRR